MLTLLTLKERDGRQWLEPDDIDAMTIGLGGILAVVVVYFFVVALQVLFYHAVHNDTEKKYTEAGWYELQRIQTDQRSHLVARRWLDPQQTVAQIPIEAAMDLALKTLRPAPQAQGPSPASVPAGLPGKASRR